MTAASKKLEYEQAAMLRDRIRLIESLDQRGTLDEHVQPEVFAADPTRGSSNSATSSRRPPGSVSSRAWISPTSVGRGGRLLVKFIRQGDPSKTGYRRFRIRTVKGIDDYAMIAEVVRRRYKYALRGEELWPDLILIDGGLGHLHAAEAALKGMIAEAVAAGNRFWRCAH